MNTKILYFIIAFSSLSINPAYSQQGFVDETFNTFDDGTLGDGFNGDVRTASLQIDGKLIVAGDFMTFNGIAAPKICRLMPDGSLDTSFVVGLGFIGNVYSSFIQADGKIVLGGSITSYNSTPVGRLIRLNQDGTRDTTFNTTVAATNGVIYSIVVQSDGKTIIAGSFTMYNGMPVNRIARILPNGSLDSSFITAVISSGFINNVQTQADGKVIIGGTFTNYNGSSQNRIARLNTNGGIDTTFSIGTGFDDDVRTIALQDDGKILVGGDFLNYKGAVANRIIRLDDNGNIDNSFITGIGLSNGYVSVIKISGNREILVGGSFTGTYNVDKVTRLFLLNSNGLFIPEFDIGAGPSSTVITASLSDDNLWYIGGSFVAFDSQTKGKLARIDQEGTLDVGYLTSGVGFDNSVLKVIVVPNNKIMAFGNFAKFNGSNATRIARLLNDGSSDTTFNVAGSGASATIRTAVVQADGRIIIGGSFSTYNGVAANRICRIMPNGALDSSFINSIGLSGTVNTLALQSDGKLIAGGSFITFNGTVVNRIVRLLATGLIDSSFNTGSGFDGTVETVLVQNDGKILIGGRFSNFNGTLYNKIVRLNPDGSLDVTFSTGIGFDKNVYALALQSDNSIIVGGNFLNFKGSANKRIIRIDSVGNIDTSFNAGTGFSNGEVRTILVQPDNRLLIGGTFSGTYKGAIAQRFLRLMPDGNRDITFSAGLNGTLFTMCFTPDAKLIIGGTFNSVLGVTKHRIARLKICTSSSLWNGVQWSNGFPDLGKSLIFNEDYTIETNTKSCSCTIATGKKVTVKDGFTLDLDMEYAGNGAIVLQNNASLYQQDDSVINTGVVIAKRKTTPIIQTDYSYWSSPVLNQRLIDLSPDTPFDKFYSFNAVNNFWTGETPTNKMQIGKGYIIRGPQNFSNTTSSIYEVSFEGIPYNGEIIVPKAGNGTSNLVGNPYPSAINADVFLQANAGVLHGTIYFWTHNTPITNNVYTSDDYAVYNLLGGVGTSAAISSGVNINKPNGNIASGQAFFTSSKSNTGSIIFNNSMRIISQNSSFFRTSSKLNLKSRAVEKHRIWLNLSNEEGAFKQILIGYTKNATDDYDSAFDGDSFNGNKFIDFYSILQERRLIIQGRAFPFDNNDTIPLGYSSAIAGIFTIAIDQVDGILSNQSVFLEDKLEKITINLKNSNYTFNTKIGIFNDRFVLRYSAKNLNMTDFNTIDNSIFVVANDNQVKINSTNLSIEKVQIFSISGKKLYNKTKIGNTEFRVARSFRSNEVLIITIVLVNGESIVKKVVVQ
ncbi:delta-60 repeat domain-containing protein [Flavobacterium segetis]|uniref:Delta-60 repeat domain-containing protein n=1 Tax=Flavobacterium segetis TaxID=271157 RepID=A0A1M5FG14_9FLAO|nr:T9SS sorting signal type C domain-containing protein [Flavobacterium segetis]SHF90428.1 delta-60 repeat domain-containing protein [Flavobacterium segetis]